MDIESLLNEEDSSRVRTDASASLLSKSRSALSKLSEPVLSPRSTLSFDSSLLSTAFSSRPDDLIDSPTDQARRSSTDMSGVVPSTPSSDAPPKNLPCANCEKRFARRSDLVRHERIHSGVRPHACQHQGCEKTFIQRSALTVHERTHTGAKPHECDQCGKPFSDSSSLARHRRTHSGARPYHCEFVGCGKQFTRKTTLTRHRQQHDRKGHVPTAHGEGTSRKSSFSESSQQEAEDIDAEGSVSAASIQPREPPSANSMYSTFSLRHAEGSHQSPSQQQVPPQGYQASFSAEQSDPSPYQSVQYSQQPYAYADQRQPAPYGTPQGHADQQTSSGYEQYAQTSPAQYYPPPQGADNRDQSGPSPYPYQWQQSTRR